MSLTVGAVRWSGVNFAIIQRGRSQLGVACFMRG